ncbi:MAG: ribosome maturation factor RimP [Pseudomonadota bacterium]
MAEPSGTERDRRFIEEAGLATRIAEIIDEPIVALGYRLVRIRLVGTDGQTLQIMAERPDGSMTIDDCETISRQLSPLLDTYDLISGQYRLEVSSPGIDRPLVRASDFDTWAGHVVKVELKSLLDGRKRFRGVLDGFDDGEVRIEVDLPELGRQILGIPLDLVAEAKLVLTDELVRESLRRAKSAAEAAASGSDTTAQIGDGSDVPDDMVLQMDGEQTDNDAGAAGMDDATRRESKE